MLSADRGQPSPQPTHLGIPASPHTPRVLHEPGSGYVAEKFEGKEQQMEEYVFYEIALESLLTRPASWTSSSGLALFTPISSSKRRAGFTTTSA